MARVKASYCVSSRAGWRGEEGAERRRAVRRWVSTVTVQKEWPDTVTVTVDEFEPVAHWNSGQLVADNGAAFEVPEADQIQGLPWLQGPDERLDDVLETWVSFNEQLQPLQKCI